MIMRTEEFFEKAVTALLIESLLIIERNELVQKHNYKPVRCCFSVSSDDTLTQHFLQRPENERFLVGFDRRSGNRRNNKSVPFFPDGQNCCDVTAFLATRKAAIFDGSSTVEKKSVLLLSPLYYFFATCKAVTF